MVGKFSRLIHVYSSADGTCSFGGGGGGTHFWPVLRLPESPPSLKTSLRRGGGGTRALSPWTFLFFYSILGVGVYTWDPKILLPTKYFDSLKKNALQNKSLPVSKKVENAVKTQNVIFLKIEETSHWANSIKAPIQNIQLLQWWDL